MRSGALNSAKTSLPTTESSAMLATKNAVKSMYRPPLGGRRKNSRR
jgi:hypothetical protein